MIKIHTLNILYLFTIFLWHALRVTVFNGYDGSGRVAFILSAFIFVINVAYTKTFFSNKSLNIWMVWFLYATIHSLLFFQTSLTHPSVYSFIINNLFVPTTIMVVISSVQFVNIDSSIRLMEKVLYAVVILYFIKSSLVEGRYLTEGFNINEVMLVVIALIATIFLRSILINRSSVRVISLMICPTFFVIMAGSRMGFGAFVILVLGFWLTKNKTFSFSLMLKLIGLSVFAFFTFDYILENTVLGERLMFTKDQALTRDDNPAIGTVFEFMGDRGIYYIYGWQLFIKQPFFGIGLRNYIATNTHVLHVEYLIHLVELGVVGFTLYVTFLFSLIKAIKRKESNELYVYLYFVLLSILFCASILFLYKSYAISYLFGLIILLTKKHSGHKLRIIK